MDNRKLSELIRMKKKKMMMEDPEVTQRSPIPEMNAQDVWDTEKKAYVETMIDSPEKINADETSLNEPSDEEIQMMDKARMERLRKYIDTLDVA